MAAPTSANRRSRCFRTTNDGRIALKPDWDEIFLTAADLPSVTLQTRHTFARLLLTGMLNEILQPNAKSDLRFFFNFWHHAWARIAFCPCCNSPGRIEICNAHDLDVIQFCAPPDTGIHTWADMIGALCSRETIAQSTEPNARTSNPAEFPRVPADAMLLPFNGGQFVALMERFREAGVALRYTLSSIEFTHTQTFTPQRVDLSEGLLTVDAGPVRLQLAMPAVQGIALSTAPDEPPSLHVFGANQDILLTLSSGTLTGSTWASIAKDAFTHHDRQST